jgi:hypothetical protein
MVASYFGDNTMAYARTAGELQQFVADTRKPKHARGFFRRALHAVFDAMADGRRRNAEREIAAYIHGRGQTLTDDAEREIERILSSSPRF